jgi:hypothetical protein
MMPQEAENSHKVLIKDIPNQRKKALADIITVPRLSLAQEDENPICPTVENGSAQQKTFLKSGARKVHTQWVSPEG